MSLKLTANPWLLGKKEEKTEQKKEMGQSPETSGKADFIILDKRRIPFVCRAPVECSRNVSMFPSNWI